MINSQFGDLGGQEEICNFLFLGVFFRFGMNIIIIIISRIIHLRVFFFLEIHVMYTMETKS